MTVTAHAMLTNFGREVDISIAILEYNGRDETAHMAQPVDLVFTSENLTEGQALTSPAPTMRLRHDVAQALYEALYKVYGQSTLPTDPHLKEALQVERRRVDKLIDNFLEVSTL